MTDIRTTVFEKTQNSLAQLFKDSVGENFLAYDLENLAQNLQNILPTALLHLQRACEEVGVHLKDVSENTEFALSAARAAIQSLTYDR